MEDSLLVATKAIRSSLPGRLRLRLPVLKGMDSETVELVTEWLKSQAPSTQVTINPRVGSALITWDPAKDTLDVTSLLTQAQEYLQSAQALGLIGTKESLACSPQLPPVREWIEKLSMQGEQAGNRFLDTLSPWVAADVKQRARKRRVTQNRLMLASLVTSIAVLAVSQSKSHVAFGIGFIALLSIHLLQHRKVL